MPVITDHLNGEYSTGSFATSLFVGNVVNLYLYGALTVQLYLYYISFPEDSRLLKATIYIIYLTETVYTILLTYGWGQSLLDGGFLYPIGSIIIPICGSIGVLQFI
ncbi:hypothetical protein F5887DRAFT_1069410 [Amanita rubescens]|nr:hypothetical protein F5887DRAFT_1069410 [Amanita rubescens]